MANQSENSTTISHVAGVIGVFTEKPARECRTFPKSQVIIARLEGPEINAAGPIIYRQVLACGKAADAD